MLLYALSNITTALCSHDLEGTALSAFLFIPVTHYILSASSC